MCRNR